MPWVMVLHFYLIWRDHGPRLWIEETNELDVYETEVSWNLKVLVAIAIAIAVRKKSLAAAEPAIQFSETPLAENEPLIAVHGWDSPPLPL
jgi:hypothetical protein